LDAILIFILTGTGSYNGRSCDVGRICKANRSSLAAWKFGNNKNKTKRLGILKVWKLSKNNVVAVAFAKPPRFLTS